MTEKNRQPQKYLQKQGWTINENLPSQILERYLQAE